MENNDDYKKYTEEKDYEIVDPPPIGNQLHCIKLKINPYEGLIVQFGKVCFSEKNGKENIDMKFDYDIVNVEDKQYENLRNDADFNKMLGDLLSNIIFEFFEENHGDRKNNT